MPGAFPIDMSTPAVPMRPLRWGNSQDSISSEEEADVYQVHGGMLKMARAMGSRGKPVHIAVRQALRRNESYGKNYPLFDVCLGSSVICLIDLVICGHSLGAGVAALLALVCHLPLIQKIPTLRAILEMWADPRTCHTHRASGLPSGRHVAAFCYAPPCLVSARLSKLAAVNNLITSFVYSYDVVSRLSLGSVRDLRRAAAWLCEAEKEGRGDGYGGITAKILKAKTGLVKDVNEEWVSPKSCPELRGPIFNMCVHIIS